LCAALAAHVYNDAWLDIQKDRKDKKDMKAAFQSKAKQFNLYNSMWVLG
jgi:hypothetical protein